MNIDLEPSESAMSPLFSRREDTRRSLLAKAGLAAGGIGVAAVASPELVSAATSDQLRFEGYNNVKDFGAAGNGSNDDTTAIINCIAASAGIATVYFPPGTYRITAQLDLPGKLVLVGQGALSVIKADPIVDPTIDLIFNSGNSDIRIEDLTLDANNKVKLYPIKIVNAQRVFIRRVEVKNVTRTTPNTGTPGYAVNLKVTFGALEDCYIHHTQRDGIHLEGSRDFVVRGNLVQDCGDDHISMSNCSNTVICGNVIVADTTVLGSGIAVYGSGSIVGNVIYGGVHSGVEIRSNANPIFSSHDVLVASNVILEAGNTQGTVTPINPNATGPGWGAAKGSGISLLESPTNPGDITRVIIKDNLISAPRNHGVVIVSTVSDKVITDVSISRNEMWLGDPAIVRQPDPTLAGSGVFVNGGPDTNPPVGLVTDIRVTDNYIRHAKGPGVSVKGSNNKRWDLRKNTVIDCGTLTANQPGIVIDGFEGFMVNDNRSQDSRAVGKTQSYGLRISNTSGANLVTNNDFTNNASGAIDQSGVNASTHILENLGANLT
jgi:hypothetical protein